MSQRVRKQVSRLEQLRKASPSLRKRLIHNCDKELLSCICECSKNLLKGNVPLTLLQKKKLSRHKHKLRELAKKSVAIKKKKKILQSGGFLGALLTPVLSLLGGLLNGGG